MHASKLESPQTVEGCNFDPLISLKAFFNASYLLPFRTPNDILFHLKYKSLDTAMTLLAKAAQGYDELESHLSTIHIT